MDNISDILIGTGQRVENLILHILKIKGYRFKFFPLPLSHLIPSPQPHHMLGFEQAVRPITPYLWGVCAIRPKNKNTYIA